MKGRSTDVGFLLLLLVMIAPLVSAKNPCEEAATACLDLGARVFQARCSLCHGSDGLGEGILPLAMESYPDTNLRDKPRFRSYSKILQAVRFGGTSKRLAMAPESPPWGDELTVAELESVSLFVELLQNDLDAALALVRAMPKPQAVDLRLGRGIFSGRCSHCHGEYGEGDGRMSKILKDPPPFNLTQSVMPELYLRDIVSRGGEKLGRSPRMPPFGGDLSEAEINSVVGYLMTIREGSSMEAKP